MPSKYISNRANFRKDFSAEIGKRVQAASIYLTGAVKADISQPGTLRFHPMTKKGNASKSQKTIYNFTHSRPGNPPFKQTGNLRMSIAWEMAQLIGRVGSNIKAPRYPLYLEMGTKKMAARPYLRRGLMVHAATLRQIITRQIPSGGVAPIRSFQFRSGHFGRGAKTAGFS